LKYHKSNRHHYSRREASVAAVHSGSVLCKDECCVRLHDNSHW